MKACLSVVETYGLTVEGGELSEVDLGHGFDISFRVGIPMADGAICSPDKALFEVLAPHFGPEPEDYGRSFKSRNEVFRIVAIKPNRPKYPISAECVSTSSFKYPGGPEARHQSAVITLRSLNDRPADAGGILDMISEVLKYDVLGNCSAGC